MNIERITEIFLELIKIDATSGNEKPVADFILSFLNNLTLKAYTDNSAALTHSNTGNVVCQIGNGGDFILTSHMDTARPTDNVIPVFNNGKISSDGSTVLGVDNRAGIAVLLYLLEYISTKNLETKNFTAAFTTCEETTIAGSKFLQLNDSIINAYVFDSYMRPGYFVNRSSGAVTFKVEIFGKASHAGIEPENGINSILIASNIISQLQIGKISQNSTLNVGIIKGGSAVNVVPEKVEFKGEIRSTERNEILNQLDVIDRILMKESNSFGAKINLSYEWDFEPFSLNEETEILKNLASVMKNVGLTYNPGLSMGGSDANSFNARGINAVNLGIGAQNPHSNNEFILLEDFKNSFEIALELVKL